MLNLRRIESFVSGRLNSFSSFNCDARRAKCQFVFLLNGSRVITVDIQVKSGLENNRRNGGLTNNTLFRYIYAYNLIITLLHFSIAHGFGLVCLE